MLVGPMLEAIDSRELSEWIAYAELEPFGEERADLRAGIIASTNVNLWRSKGQPACRADAFMPKFDREEKAAPAIIPFVDYFRTLAIAMGGKVVKRGDNQ